MKRNCRESKPNKQDFDTIRDRMRKTDIALRKSKRTLIKEEERQIEILNETEIETIIVDIKTFYQNNDISRVFQLINQICQSVEDGFNVVFSNQLFQPILSYLNSENHKNNLMFFITNLADIINESFGSISSILNLEFQSIITKLGCHHDNEIKSAIINLISKISNHGEKSCCFLLDLNLPDLFSLNYQDNSCQENICKTIRNIFDFKPSGCDVISREFINILKQNLLQSNFNCKLDIIWSFLYVLDSEFMLTGDLLDENLTKYFIELISIGDEKINLPILKILNYIFFDCISLKNVLLENNVLCCLFGNFPMKNCDCWRECVFFLTNVASGGLGDLIALRNSNVLSFIVYSLTNGTYRIQEEACYFFKSITKEESADEICYWFSKDVVLLFCQLLRPDNTDLNCLIVDILICCLIYSNNFDELSSLFGECNVVNAIEESRFHMTESGYKLYMEFLSVLSGENICPAESTEEEENMVYEF